MADCVYRQWFLEIFLGPFSNVNDRIMPMSDAVSSEGPKRRKMAPRMAAVVWNAAVLLMFLFVCSVFSHSLTISFTRDKLLDIRQHTPDNFFCFFIIQMLCWMFWSKGQRS